MGAWVESSDVQSNGIGNARRQDYPVLTAVLCAWCVIVFAAMYLAKSHSWEFARRWGWISDWDIYHGEYWGLLTSAYVHIEPLHLAFNVYWLWILGGAFERELGPIWLMAFVVVAAFVSSGIQLLSGSSGIGMSGVGYALVGFGWIARRRYPAIAATVNERVIMLFVVWGVFCVFATYVGFMRVGNLAHAAGFAVGIALATAATLANYRALGLAGMVVLAAASIAPLFWNPRSPEWLGARAVEAQQGKDFSRAIEYYRGYLEIGVDREWALSNLATIYGEKGDVAGYAKALGELEALNPERAAEIRQIYGNPQDR